MGGPMTPAKRGPPAKRPRKLYQPVIPELEETLQQGMAVFVRDVSAGWITAKIVEVTNSHLVINDGTKQREARPCDVVLQPKGIDYPSVEDLTKLSPLSTPAVLHCLQQRYTEDEIYTRAGETLVAINPFKVIPGLYDEERMEKYHNHLTNESERRKPHVYETAELAFRAMKSTVNENHNQSIIVSGESGAGKTESASHLMRYLVTISGEQDETRDVAKRIEQRILISNPILESFGNASTLRNHNSSRFGKFIQLHFDNRYHLEGASVKTYLLEKTRVAHQADGECTFHVFYQIVAGLDQNNRKSLHMQDVQLFGSERRDEARDKDSYNETIAALHRLGLKPTELGAIIQILCALIHLMQVKIVVDEEDDGVCEISEESRNQLQIACDIMCVNLDDLERAILYRRITATHKRRMSVFSKPCSLEEAQNRLNCLMTTMYSSLFSWLVQKINNCTQSDSPFADIGILDIYGFESFEDNSLEQLCINYANEKLQQHFVSHFLRDLQADYEREAVNWEATNFSDNRPCLDLLEANPGVFALVNEECYLNRPSNAETLNERIVMTFNGNNHLSKAPRSAQTPQFVIQHYAAPVCYSVEHLVEKNKDNVPSELTELIQRCSHVLEPMLTLNAESEQPGKKKKTVLTKFKNSLDQLMATLEGTQAHYIRCIKPNPSSAPSKFQADFVLQQLEANGVVEAVDICRKGYPTRIVYEDFLKQFGLILRFEDQSKTSHEDKENVMDNIDALYQKQLRMTPRRLSTTPKSKLRRRADRQTGLSSCDHSRKLCASILRNVFGSQITDWSKTCGQFGRTKLFLKHGQLEKLESVRLKLLSKFAFTIQCAWRRYLRNKQLKQLRAVICIQSAVRGWLARQELRLKEEAAIVVQKAFRRFLEKRAEKEAEKEKQLEEEVEEEEEEKEEEEEEEEGQEVDVERLICLTPQKAALDDHGDTGLCADLLSDAVKAGFSPTPKKSADDSEEDSFIVCTEIAADSVIYHIIPSPAKASPSARSRASPLGRDSRDSPVARASPLVASPLTRSSTNATPGSVTPVSKRIQSRLRDSPKTTPKKNTEYTLTPQRTQTPEYTQTPMRSMMFSAASFSPASFSPACHISSPRTYKNAFHSVAAAVSAAFMTRRKFHLAGAFNGIPYFEAKDGILSRRRMPKVHIRFHTRPNPLLKCGHYISQQEFQCSLTDCLND